MARIFPPSARRKHTRQGCEGRPSARGATAATDEISLLAAKVSNFLCRQTPRLCQRNRTTAGLLFPAAAFLGRAALAGGQRLVDRELVELATLLDEGREPSRSSAAACPGFAAGSTILGRHFAPFQRRAAAKYGSRNTRSLAAFSAQPRKLLFQFAALLTKPFVNVGAQCKQRVDVHTF